ncbi:PTS sugar transporter subunit IIA [Providencia sp. PROV259]|uniref:PTS sugar transporter subunit IIA n=1 Tax=Providencia sp. PROV259 TaxID=2949947 RepID=UPI00234B9E1D|nr:PTS sugar transporter subunit IIA [Providencia sp. PROV259]
MSSQLPIILASHGPFAQGLLECAEMLIGTQEDISVISIQRESNINEVKKQLFDTYQRINQGNGVLILVDLLGGSPCNLASELVLTQNDVALYCGINVPTFLEILSNRDLPLHEIHQVINDVFPVSCINVGEQLKPVIQDETEL